MVETLDEDVAAGKKAASSRGADSDETIVTGVPEPLTEGLVAAIGNDKRVLVY